MDVKAGTIAPVGKDLPRPGAIVLAHLRRRVLHVFDVEEDHRLRGESFGGGTADRVIGLDLPARRIHELRIAVVDRSLDRIDVHLHGDPDAALDGDAPCHVAMHTRAVHHA